MRKMLSAWLGLCLVVLVTASCSSPPLPELADGGGHDGATNDGGSPGFGLELVAGDIGRLGSADGVGAAARFSFPSGVAVDSTGNVYVADHVLGRTYDCSEPRVIGFSAAQRDAPPFPSALGSSPCPRSHRDGWGG